MALTECCQVSLRHLVKMGTQLKACNYNGDRAYRNVRTFNSENERFYYFVTQSIDIPLTWGGKNYIKNGVVKVDFNADELAKFNYLVFTNKSKHMYAFVDNIEWVDAKTSLISYTIDVFQTYAEEFEIKPSFVVRSHMDRWAKNYDSPIYNRLNDDIDVGTEVQASHVVKLNSFNDDRDSELHRIVAVYITRTEALPNDPFPFPVNGAFYHYVSFVYSKALLEYPPGYELDVPFSSADGKNRWASLEDLSEIFEQDATVSVKIVPLTNLDVTADLVTIDINSTSVSNYYVNMQGTTFNYKTEPAPVGGLTLGKIRSSTPVKSKDYNVNIQDLFFQKPIKPDINATLDSPRYEPKLFTKPMRFIRLEHPDGTYYDLDPADILGLDPIFSFNMNNAQFEQTSRLWLKNSQGNSIYDRRYCEVNEKITLDVANDPYINYILTKRNNELLKLGVSVGSTLAGVGLTVLTAGAGTAAGIAFAGAGIGTGTMIANHMARQQELKDQPDSLKTQGGLFDYLSEQDLFNYKIIGMEIKDDFMNQAYLYFRRFGYPVRRYMQPNIKSRKKFNYLQTEGANVVGDLPREILDTIATSLNNGVTFWHDDDMLNDELNNYEVSLDE